MTGPIIVGDPPEDVVAVFTAFDGLIDAHPAPVIAASLASMFQCAVQAYGPGFPPLLVKSISELTAMIKTANSDQGRAFN